MITPAGNTTSRILSAIARARGLSATAVACDEAETLGVNSRADLAAAEAAFQARARTMAMDAGVTLVDPDRCTSLTTR